jgi:hypothetical protein
MVKDGIYLVLCGNGPISEGLKKKKKNKKNIELDFCIHLIFWLSFLIF